jgi:hypothetical protein
MMSGMGWGLGWRESVAANETDSGRFHFFFKWRPIA